MVAAIKDSDENDFRTEGNTLNDAVIYSENIDKDIIKLLAANGLDDKKIKRLQEWYASQTANKRIKIDDSKKDHDTDIFLDSLADLIEKIDASSLNPALADKFKDFKIKMHTKKIGMLQHASLKNTPLPQTTNKIPADIAAAPIRTGLLVQDATLERLR